MWQTCFESHPSSWLGTTVPLSQHCAGLSGAMPQHHVESQLVGQKTGQWVLRVEVN